MSPADKGMCSLTRGHRPELAIALPSPALEVNHVQRRLKITRRAVLKP